MPGFARDAAAAVHQFPRFAAFSYSTEDSYAFVRYCSRRASISKVFCLFKLKNLNF